MGAGTRLAVAHLYGPAERTEQRRLVGAITTGEVILYLKLDELTDDERARFLTFLAKQVNPEFRGDPPRLVFVDFAEDAALVKTTHLRNLFCEREGIMRDRIRWSLDPHAWS